VLFHGSRADVQLFCDFLVAAAFDEQVQNLFIAVGDLDFTEIQHYGFLSACLRNRDPVRFLIESNSITQSESKCFAKVSPAGT